MAEPATFDWASFFALFWNDKGLKCKVNIPDTVIFRFGQLSAWWATNKDGQVQRHTSQSTSMEAIRRRFLQVANEDEANYSKFVCISRLGDGKPQLLRVMAFNQLCELLSDRLESGHPDAAPEIETPSVLQAFIQPYQDLRYVTTYINTGTSVTCHTFQRKYSRRYTPMSAATAAAMDSRDADIIMAVGDDADARRAEIDAQQGAVEPSLKMQLRKLTAHIVKYIERAHGLTLGGIVCEFIKDASGKVYLLSVLRTEWASNASGHGAGSLSATNIQQHPRELEYEEDGGEDWRQGEEQQAAMEPQYQYHQQAAGVAGMAGAHATTSFSAWSGHDGGGPSGSASQRASSPAGVRSRSGSPSPTAQLQQQQGGAGHSGRSSGGVLDYDALSRPMSARPVSRAGGGSAEPLMPTPAPTAGAASPAPTRSSLVQYPGGQSRLGGLGIAVNNTWPSLQHEVHLSPGSPTSTLGPSASATTVGGGGDGGSERGYYRSGSGHALQSPSAANGSGGLVRAQSARASTSQRASSPIPERSHYSGVRPTSSPSAGGSRSRSPSARPPLGFMSTTNRSTYTSPDRPYSTKGSHGFERPYLGPSGNGAPGAPPLPPTGALTARGDHVNAGVRGTPLLVSQLQREVEMLRDQLVYQHELAEASAAKVRQLEREKQISTDTFDNRRHELEHLLATTREELAATRADRDQWRQRAESAEATAAEATGNAANLQDTLQAERGTAMTALREYQDRDTSQRERMQQLESEVLRLSEHLKMETTAVNTLKRQLLEFSEIAERHKATLRDGTLEPGMQEVLDRINPLFAGQTNPTGEQYAVQKVLFHYHADLRAVFLYYAQLEASFTDYWPPSMRFAQWMLFCKDSETSDIRAGARIRSSQHFLMLHPQECENIFHKYSRVDAAAKAHGVEEQVLSYEMFLAAVVHVAQKIKRPDVPYLSEALREYILRYLARAQRVAPQGLKRGQMRTALEGTFTDMPAGGAGGGGGGGGGSLLTSGASSPVPPAAPESGKKKRGKSASAAGSGSKGARAAAASTRPATAASPIRQLHDAGNSAVLKELALLGLSQPGANKETVRTGGGFALP